MNICDALNAKAGIMLHKNIFGGFYGDFMNAWAQPEFVGTGVDLPYIKHLEG